MVIALGGRRIDTPHAREMRFPAERVADVAEEIRTTLERLGAKVLVCSAACGADLLALNATGQLRIRRPVVLPFDRDQFRQTSVVDRPGNWGELYDRILDHVQPKGDWVVLGFQRGDRKAYRAANERLLAEAEALADDDMRPCEFLSCGREGLADFRAGTRSRHTYTEILTMLFKQQNDT